MKSDEYEWPKTGDIPFGVGGDNAVHVDLKWLGLLSTEMISKGFLSAANLVVEALQTNSTNDLTHPDRFFFPVAYMFRHALELKLKELLDRAEALNFPCGSAKVKGQHGLEQLWNQVRPFIESFNHGVDNQPLLATERIILSFHDIDPNGQVLRYAKTKDNVPHTYGNHRIVDLVNLKNVANAAYNLLDCCCAQCDVELDCLKGMENYYQ